MIKNIHSIKSKEILKGIHASFIHTEKFTLGFVTLEKGAILPEHSHIHEQTSQVIEGVLEMTIDGKKAVLKPGMIAIIPSHIKHSARALTTCSVRDTFCPVREDYK